MTDGHPTRSEGRMERLARKMDSVWTLVAAVAQLNLLEKLVQRQVDARFCH